MKQTVRNTVYTMALAAGINFGLVGTASAHCDSIDGPVISEAKQALASGDVTPLLKWVPADDEAQIRTVFDKTHRFENRGVMPRRLPTTISLPPWSRCIVPLKGLPSPG